MRISDWSSDVCSSDLASIASWDGDKLTLWTSNQMIAWSTGDVAKTLGIPKENVRLVSPYIGGGFGGKLFIRSDALLAALGAKEAGRPVKQIGRATCRERVVKDG